MACNNDDQNLKTITFYKRFKDDIINNLKTITIRKESDANYNENDLVRVSNYEDGFDKNKPTEYYCTIKIISNKKIHFDQLNENHAKQENMTLDQLKQVISEIYPGLKDLYLIEFVKFS